MATLNIFALIPLYLKYQSKVQDAWTLATSNKDFLDIIEREIPVIADLAGSLVGDIAPQSEPAVRKAIAIVLTFNHEFVKWGQRAVNLAATAELITLDAPLVIDGFWGPKSAAGFKKLQEYAIANGATGILTDGLIAKVGQALIESLHIPGLEPVPE